MKSYIKVGFLLFLGSIVALGAGCVSRDNRNVVTAPAANSALATDVPMTAYNNSRDHFALRYPTAWKLRTDLPNVAMQVEAPTEGNGDSFSESMNVVERVQPYVKTPFEEFANNTVNAIKADPNVRVVEETDVTLDGVPAKRLVFVSNNTGGRPQKWLEFNVLKDNVGFSVTFTAEEAQFDRYAPLFTAIARTFTFRAASDAVSQIFTHPKDRYQITHPESWEVGIADPATSVAISSPRASATDTFRENLNIIITPVTPQTTGEQYIENSLKNIQGLANFRLATTTSLTLAGVNAKAMTYTATVSGQTLVFTQAFFLKNQRGFMVTCVFQPAAAAAYSGECKKMMESLKVE